MDRKHFTAAMIAIMLSLPAYSQKESLNATFSRGIPKDFKTLNLDGMSVAKKYFNNLVMPEDLWYVCNEKGIGEETFEFVDPEVANPAVGARYGLLSCSRRENPNKSTDNRLILPQLKIVDGFGLRWSARSVHFNFKESYKIMVSTTDNAPSSFEEVCRIDDESYVWRERYLDLSRYSGKNIYVAIVHCSTNKFLLALDYIEGGVFTDRRLNVQNTGRHYFGATDGLSLHFKVSNHGGDADVAKYEVRNSEDGTVLGSVSSEYGVFRRGDSRDVAVSLTDYTGSCYYNLVAMCKDGSESVIFTDFVNKSDFARKMYVMKLTGTWCNSCPKVGYAAHLAQELLGEECIYAEIHQDGNGVDKDGFTDIINEYSYTVKGDYPSLWYNLTHSKDTYRYRDYSAFKKSVLTPCEAEVRIKEAEKRGEKLYVKATVKFAGDKDNSADRYRVGILFADKEVAPHPGSNEQQWQSPGGSAAYGEYFFMPTSFPKEINPLEHVVRTPVSGAKGIPTSLPAQIIGMEEYEVEFETDFKETFRAENVIAIANVIDSESKTFEVLNSDMADVSGIESPELVLVPLSGDVLVGNKCRIDAYGLKIGEIIEWSSSDTAVATVDNSGYVSGVSAGTVKITASTSMGRTAECSLDVKTSNSVNEAANDLISVVRIGDEVKITVADGNNVITVYGLGGEIKRKVECDSEEVTLRLPEISIIRIESKGKIHTRKI